MTSGETKFYVFPVPQQPQIVLYLLFQAVKLISFIPWYKESFELNREEVT